MAKAKAAPKEYLAPTTKPLDLGPPPTPTGPSDAATDGLGESCVAVRDMEPHWKPIQAVLGGTPGMRAQNRTWLPQEKHEKEESYSARIDRSILFNMFRDAVEKAVAKPFSKPVTIRPSADELDETLRPIVDDADRQGHDLTAFARLMFRDAVTFGGVHLIVDVPKLPDGMDSETARRKDVQQALDLRPYFALVTAPNFIGWEEDDLGNLICARVREWHVVRKGWKEESVEHIRVWRAAYSVDEADGTATDYPAMWTLYRKGGRAPGVMGKIASAVTLGAYRGGGDGWAAVESGGINYPGPGLPIVSLVLEPCGKRIGYPPLEDSAWLTTAHWQSHSDYRNILRFVSVGILLIKGISAEEMGGAVVVAANHAVRTENTDPGCDMKYVEHSGAAIGALERCLTAIEQRADVVSLNPLIDSVGTATATGRAIDETKSQCSIQAWARAAERVLEQAFRMAADWVGKELPEEFGIDIFNDFGLSGRATTDVQMLIQMRAANMITHETFLREVKARGTLSDMLEIDAEVEKVKAEKEKRDAQMVGLGGLFGPTKGEPGGPAEDDEEGKAAA